MFDIALDTDEKRQEFEHLVKIDTVAYVEIPNPVVKEILDKAFKE